MWKELSIFFIIIISIDSIYAAETHLEKLKAKFPYALLGDDFGVLNEEDLAISACMALPSLFVYSGATDYPYWQCFETKTAKLFCDGHGYDSDEKKYYTIMVVSGIKNNELHEYITRDRIYYDSCLEYMNDWKRLVKNEKYVCVSGPYIYKDQKFKTQIRHAWIFNSFKTKKGCEPYFKGWCDLKYLLKQGKNCDPNRK